MADILIRGMEMPATCWDCKLKVGFSACGLVTDHKDGGFFYRVHNGNPRPDWCPLVPLPEGHGDLMDKAAFEADVRKRYCHGCDNANGLKCRACWVDDMLGEVDDAPTIVPAEGGENEWGN